MLIIIPSAYAQVTQNATSLLKLYEDDDYFNVWGRGTDRAYTNGTSIGYLYMKRKRDKFIDKWLMPKAGPDAINVWEWGVMQMMMTPNDLHDSAYIPDDFYYSAALFARHGLTSYNSEKKYSLHSEILIGVMGPWALGERSQTFVHHLIGDQPPQGWSNQVPNAPVLNFNFTFERMLWHPVDYLEIVGSTSAQAGTMIDAVGAKTILRAGLFNPWFGDRDLSKATKHKFQVYAFAAPVLTIQFYNALLQGGLFSGKDENFNYNSAERTTHLNPFVLGLDYGVGFKINRCSFVYTQQSATAWMSGTGNHSVGNFTILISLSKKPPPSPHP